LKINGLQEGKVVYLRLHDITSASGHYPWTTEAFYTLNNKSAQSGPTFTVANTGPSITIRPADNPSEVRQGLTYKQYEGFWDAIPEFNSLTPVNEGSVTNFDISSADGKDYLGYVFEGYIDIPVSEEVTFYLNSDDGSKLYIGDKLVVNNDGLHTVKEASGKIALEAGKHAIRVEYIEGNGGAY
jgi:hypothetical protein